MRNFNDLESDRNFIEISILKFPEFQDHFLEVLSDPAWARILSDFGEINGKILNFGEINGKILKFRGPWGASEFQDEISMNFTPWNFTRLNFESLLGATFRSEGRVRPQPLCTLEGKGRVNFWSSQIF